MNDKELREGGPPSRWDYTMRVTWRCCPRKFYWFRRGYDYASEPPYFIFGRAWGATMGKWHSSEVNLAEMDDGDRVLWKTVALRTGEALWEASGVEGSRGDTLDNFRSLFGLYVDHYPYEAWTQVGAEQGWEWPLAGTPYILAGAMDAYLDWPHYGFLVREDKTTGMYMGDAFLAQWSFSPQVTGYVWYLVQLHGEEVFGCLMNLASKRVTKNSTGEDLFARSLEKRSPWQLDKYVEEFVHDIKEVEREWESWVWPMASDPRECVGGIGKAACLFRTLCRTERGFEDVEPLNFQGIILRDTAWEPWLRRGSDS